MRMTVGLFLLWVGVWTLLDLLQGHFHRRQYWWKSKTMVLMGVAAVALLAIALRFLG